MDVTRIIYWALLIVVMVATAWDLYRSHQWRKRSRERIEAMARGVTRGHGCDGRQGR
jgi:hypothetical protein